MVQFAEVLEEKRYKREVSLIIEGMGQEEPLVVSVNEAFSEIEQSEIKDALSAALGSEVRTRTRVEESFELLPIITIFLGTMGAVLLAGFLGKMGSDLWDYAKKKIVEVAVKPQNSNGTRIELGFHYQGAKVVCALRSNDPSVLLKALDEWRVVLAEVLDLGNDHNLPGTEAYVYYKFRNGRWRIDEAAVMQPEFDILVFDYQLRKWVPRDANASKVLREFQRKMREKKSSGDKTES